MTYFIKPPTYKLGLDFGYERDYSTVVVLEYSVFQNGKHDPTNWQWIHEHRFEAVPGGTRVLDHVRYVVPGGPLAPLLHALFVKRDLRRIFTWRAQRLGALLLGATHAPLAGSLALS